MTELETEYEFVRVEKWREKCLRKAGYSKGAAQKLAMDNNVDLHKAIELIKQAEDEDLVLRILL